MLLPRVLVLYATTDGHTRKVAFSLSEAIRSGGIEVDVVNARSAFDPKPDDYDGVIVAASVHVGGYQRSVRKWVKAHAEALRARPTAFVSVCLRVLEHNPATDAKLHEIMAGLFTETGWRPAVTKMVAGALPYTKYNWFMRRVMRRIVAKAHGDTDTSRDYEYTDWADVHAFGRKFGEQFRAPAKARIAV